MKGHIQKRGTSWRVVIDTGKDPATGKRRQHFETIKGNKSAAQRRLAELLLEIEKGGYVKTPRTLTVAE